MKHLKLVWDFLCEKHTPTRQIMSKLINFTPINYSMMANNFLQPSWNDL